MPFTSKERADYVEMINSELDSIRVDDIADFESLKDSLQSIVQRASNNVLEEKFEAPEKYKEIIASIREYLTEPESWVAHEANYAEYQEIVKNRILNKIAELSNMRTNEKEVYIRRQEVLRQKKEENANIMAQHRAPQPGEDAYLPDLSER